MMHSWQPSFNLHPNKTEEREVRERVLSSKIARNSVVWEAKK